MIIHLPFPPSINGYWRAIIRKHGTKQHATQIISERGRKYRSDALKECCRQHVTGLAINERLAVKIVLNPPTRRKYDVDNFCKGVLDAMTHANVWLDDEQIDDLHVVKGEVVKGGNVVIAIQEAG